MSHLCAAGYDLYEQTEEGQVYRGTFMPPYDLKEGYESVVHLKDRKMREFIIHFPLYGGAKKLYVGIEKEAEILPAKGYLPLNPIVYYGSSITQGGCASRPGMAYQSQLASKLNVDFINLGFSGNAKGEETMARYIADLSMSLFVMDYDHNAPTAEHLENTHEAFFKIFREKHPKTPVLFLTRPKFTGLSREEEKRREIVYQTYARAKAQGDAQVYFLSGTELMAFAKENGTVDNCHPNDLGFYSMALALEPVIRNILDL